MPAAAWTCAIWLRLRGPTSREERRPYHVSFQDRIGSPPLTNWCGGYTALPRTIGGLRLVHAMPSRAALAQGIGLAVNSRSQAAVTL